MILASGLYYFSRRLPKRLYYTHAK